MTDTPDDRVARGVSYVLGQCNAYLELGMANTIGRIRVTRELRDLLAAVKEGGEDQILASKIDALLESVASIDEAATDQVQRAQLATAALAKRLRSAAKEPPRSSASLADIEVELRRREAFALQARVTQEELEDRDIAAREEFEVITALMTVEGPTHKPAWTALKNELSQLKNQIDALVFGIAENARDVHALKSYAQALRLVESGIDVTLIGRNFYDPAVIEKRKKPQG
jgi:hypothetical protein